MKRIWFICCMMICCIGQLSAQEISIIPQPQHLEKLSGNFTLNPRTRIQFIGDVNRESLEPFIERLRETSGFKLKERRNPQENVIRFEVDPQLPLSDPEAYTLNIDAKGISLVGKTSTGLFYATQSLRQLLPLAIDAQHTAQNTDWTLPAVRIEDQPRYSWRGFMLDVSRTFYDVDVVKKFLDLMAMYKLNTFHWHLTDDQGWRIEIKKYPKLTSKLTTTFAESEHQPVKRSGYYTQEEIKEIVAYAQARNITIIPEIDVPGHTWPVLLAYPELAVNDNLSPHYVFPFVSSWGYWGNQFTPNTLDPTNEKVYAFLRDVFTEIAALFPGKYIHFGGDEVQHKLWEKNPHVQAFMKAHDFKGFGELQSYFVGRLIDIFEDLGKKPIGWNDILQDDENLPKSTAIMSWLGARAMKEATSHGFKAVATPSSHLYFDITQANRNDGTPSDLAYPQINSIERVYHYNPSAGLTTEEEKLVLGVQANMWTALAQEVKTLSVQVFPRLLAVAEIGWTLPENLDYPNFQTHLTREKKRLDLLKVPYYHKGGFIVDTWSPNTISAQYNTLSFDVTQQVYTNGRAVAGFFFTKGKNFLEIDGVQLYKNGQLISEDPHHAIADKFRGTNKIKPFYFNLTVDHYDPEATYTLKAKVRGVKGTDSYGNFTFNLNPYQPFTVVDKK